MRFSTRQQTLLLDPAQQDDAPWLGLAPPGASHGWRAVGPAGFVARLELLAGRPQAPADPDGRFLSWYRATCELDDGMKSYSASRAVDPLGVASHLLTLRDAAREAGWDTKRLAGTPLLEELQALEDVASVAPTLCERARALRSVLHLVPCDVRVVAPKLAAPWLAALLDHLVAVGGSVSAVESRPPPAGSDLARLHEALRTGRAFEPGGDGTVVFVEEDTAWAAGRHLLARDDLEGAVWVVSAQQGLLDAMRHAAGHPRLGLADDAAGIWRTALWLRLQLELDPRDVDAAFALVTLRGGPLSGPGERLARALRDVPATHSEPWEAAVEAFASRAARAAYEGPGTAEARAAEAIHAAQAARDLVATWVPTPGRPPDIEGCLASLDGPPELRACIDAIRALLDIEGIGPTRQRLGEWFARIPSPRHRRPAEAGHPPWSRDPAAAAPASRVIWWGFVGPVVDGPLAWSATDRRALVACGVHPPSARERRSLERARWLRPLFAASERLVLVRWRTESGGPADEHPLQDELLALMGRDGITRCTADGGPLRTTAVRLQEPPAPRSTWSIPPPDLGPPRTESPTSIEAKLGCPLRWTLRYAAGLRAGDAHGPLAGAPLAGTLAHLVLQDVLIGPNALDVRAAGTSETEDAAGSSFDQHVLSVAPVLAESGMGRERERLRTLTVRAAVELVHQLQVGGWWPIGVEELVGGRFGESDFEGFADLVLTNGSHQIAVLDFKLGRLRARQEQLQQERAIQLALYASGLRTSPEGWPVAGYLIVNEGRLLATGGFPDAIEVPSSLPATFQAAMQVARFWTDELLLGRVHARAPDLHAPPDGLPDHPLSAVEAPCPTCDFGVLCGRRGAR
ncbi:MAG: PD-(D/E)XK nuclease family protein [Alphaproteobacteria bacterium]|nr:PD-(D/E)XK nuclease family protein [Alphaproteobacteria bacterium]